MKKIKSIIILLFIFISSQLISQTIYHGKIINKKTNEPIPFVNIGILNLNIGTVSSENGEFKIKLPDSCNSEVLKFSTIGFSPKTYEIGNFIQTFSENEEIIISLENYTYPLKEHVVYAKKKKWKYKTLGNKNESDDLTVGFNTNELGVEIGTLIKIKKSPTHIENFSFYIAHNNLDSLYFRLNIYDYKNGESLLDSNIYINTNIKNGKVLVDLKNYNIIVKNDFLISIENIKYPKNNDAEDELLLGSGLFNNQSYMRMTSQASWFKIPIMGIGFNVKVKY